MDGEGRPGLHGRRHCPLELSQALQAPDIEKGITGNPVGIGSGPAAVTGDKNLRYLATMPFKGHGKAEVRMNREPEDLPAGH